MTMDKVSIETNTEITTNTSVKFSIQINKKLNCNNTKPKAELKADIPKFNALANWKKIECDAKSLAYSIGRGAAYRGGIKVNGNSKADLESIQVIVLDFDDKDWSEEKLLAEEFFKKYAAFWHRSPSWTEDWHKTRVVFILDKSVGVEDGETMIRYLLRKYKQADQNCKDAGRWFYGARLHDWVFEFDFNNTLPVDTFLLEALQDETTTPVNQVTSDKFPEFPDTNHTDLIQNYTVTEQFLYHVWQHCPKERPYDIYELIYESKFQPDTEGNYRGSNPFKFHSGERSETGLKVTVNREDENLPPIWYEYHTTESGNVLQYYFFVAQMGLLRHGKRQLYKGKKLSDKGVFTRVCRDFCQYVNIPTFKFKTGRKGHKDSEIDLQEIYVFLAETLPQYIYRAEWDQSKSVFLYYNLNDGVWKISSSLNKVYSNLVTTLLENKFSKNIALNPDVGMVVNNVLLKDNIFNASESKIIFDRQTDRNIIPLADGDFNLTTKEFTPGFDPDIKNFYRLINTYSPGYKTENVDKVLGWINDIYTPEKAKLVTAWLIANAQGLGHRLTKLLSIYGTPGTGKSVVGNLIVDMLGNTATIENYNNFLGVHHNRFSFQNLDGKQSVFIDEFDADQRAWQSLKLITGSGEPNVSIEKKGLTKYDIKFLGLITTCTQDDYRLPNNDDGGIKRRIIPLQHTPDMIRQKYRYVDNEFKAPQLLNDLFMWCLFQDGNQAIKDINEYDQKHGVNILYEVGLESDSLLAFIVECCDVTGDSDDFTSNQDIYNAFNEWFDDVIGHDDNLQNKAKIKIANISRIIRKKINPSNKFYKQVDITRKYDKKLNGMVRGLTGIKLKPELSHTETSTEF